MRGEGRRPMFVQLGDDHAQRFGAPVLAIAVSKARDPQAADATPTASLADELDDLPGPGVRND